MQELKSLNTPQAAEYLNQGYNIPVTPGTMEVWRSLGRGPRYRKVARWVIYDRADLDRFASGQVVETTDSISDK
jgi:hypothetical protein